jgi:hypothetical protein
MRKLPNELNDGTHQYRLVRQEEQLDDGRTNVALYERVPEDPGFQFTPCLAFCLGQTDAPGMLRIER